jgi:23S rRNA pseudouridine1911/1915/1917 synthase
VSDPYPIKSFAVPVEAAGRRLDQWLAAQLPEASRARVQVLMEQNKVLVNGRAGKPSLRLRGGEQIAITGPAELPSLKATPENIPLDVVYEDDALAVVNKPAGMSVHAGSGKSGGGSRGTLVNALLHRFQTLSGLGGELRPGIVHRLDRQTSGLLVVAKNDVVHRNLAGQFAAREVGKNYLALVHGRMAKSGGAIESPIGRDLRRRTRMTTRRSPGNKAVRSAITHWKVLKEIKGPYGDFSLLEATIETGRTHQIRVHLASIGHPVVGDTLYGAPRTIPPRAGVAPRSLTLTRNFLHAYAIEFRHPVTNKPISFKQVLPGELEAFLQEITG